jgi:hypothetical protein
MELISRYKFHILLIIVMYLYSQKREIHHYHEHTDTKIFEWTDTITKLKKVRQTLLKRDTIFIDTFTRDSNGLKNAIRINRYVDSITSESFSH